MTLDALRALHRAITNAETAGIGIADLAAEGLIPLDTAVADLRKVFVDMLAPVREEIAKEIREAEVQRAAPARPVEPAVDETPRKFSLN